MVIEPHLRKLLPPKMGVKWEEIILEKNHYENFWKNLTELAIIIFYLSKEQKRFEGYKTLSDAFHCINKLQDKFANDWSDLSCAEINLPQSGICMFKPV